MSYFDKYKGRRSKDSSDTYRSPTKEFVNSSFANSPTYKVILIDGKETGVRVLEGKDSSYKKLLFLPDTKLDVGLLVNIDSKLWLITDFVDTEIIPKAMLQYCNNTLRLDEEDIPCIISRSDLVKFDVEENRNEINILQGAVYVFAQLNDASKKIAIGRRFVLGLQAYKVVGIDDLTYSKNGIGLIRYSMKLVSKSEEDDFDTGLAGNTGKEGSDWI